MNNFDKTLKMSGKLRLSGASRAFFDFVQLGNTSEVFLQLCFPSVGTWCVGCGAISI